MQTLRVDITYPNKTCYDIELPCEIHCTQLTLFMLVLENKLPKSLYCAISEIDMTTLFTIRKDFHLRQGLLKPDKISVP